MVMLGRLLHLIKAQYPMLVTPLGIVIPVSVEQPVKDGGPILKAHSGIDVIVLPLRSR
jgi:hypothetical protein